MTAELNGPIRELVAQAEFVLTEMIRKGEVRADSAMAVIGKGMEIMERFKYIDGSHKRVLLLEILERVATAGAPGALPASTIAAIRQILSSDLLDQTIGLIIDVSKGRIGINAAATAAVSAAATAFPAMGSVMDKAPDLADAAADAAEKIAPGCFLAILLRKLSGCFAKRAVVPKDAIVAAAAAAAAVPAATGLKT